MIAVSSTKTKVIECDVTGIEVRVRGDTASVIIPTTVDYAACMKQGITTLLVEMVQESSKSIVSTADIKSFNEDVAKKADTRLTAAKSEVILLSKNIDITKMMSTTFAGQTNVKSLSIEELRAKFPLKSVVTPQKVDKMPSAEGIVSTQDYTAVSVLGVDPGSIKTGALPLDTVAAISGVILHDMGYAVSTLKTDSAGSEILALRSTASEKIGVSITGKISRDQIAASFIRITARSKGVESQVVTIKNGLSELYDKSRIPTLPPTVKGSYSSSGRLVINATQRDASADSLSIFYRPISDFQNGKTGFRAVSTNLKCLPGQTITLPTLIAENAVIRVHAAANGKTSVSYGSFVAKSHKRGRVRSDPAPLASLIAYNTQSGISLNLIVRGGNISAVAVRRKNMRTGEIANITSLPAKTTSMQGFIDETASDLTQFVYFADLYMRNGVVYREAASASILRLKPRNIVEANVTATSNIVGNQTVQIKIEPFVKSNDVNFLVNYVKSIGLELAFQTDLETVKKSLLNCVKFDVIRYDLLTGEASYVGQTDSSITDDIEDVKISSSFLYICEAFVRSPSQLADVISDRSNKPVGINPDITRLGLHITKADVDSRTTGKSSISTARKNFSRSNFETGTMPAAPAADSFRDGRTGDVFTAKASVVPSFPTVDKVVAIKQGDSVVISWGVAGDDRLVDRFQVYAQSSGATWSVASASVPGIVKVYQLRDTNAYTMPRYIKYHVIPVFLDGTKGSAAYSQEILLEKQQEI